MDDAQIYGEDCLVKALKVLDDSLQRQIKSVDHAGIRIDEHERSCGWCAANFPKMCARLELLQLARDCSK